MSEMNGGDGKKKKKDDDGDRSVHSLSSSPSPSPDEASVEAARRDRDRDAVPIFSAAQPRPAAASATAFAESKAALRRRARVRRQALMVVAGRLPGEQRPAGVHPAGHRSLLVVVVVVPLIATARGSVGQRRGALSRSTRTYTSAYRQAPGPNPVCVWIGRWSTLLIGGGQTVPGGGSAAAERDAPSSVHRVAERQAI